MIVAGFGFRAAVSPAALRDALRIAADGHAPVSALATLADKVAPLVPLAEALGLPLIAVPADRLAAVTPATRSAASLRARGTGSVAEAAALAAAGPGARLIGPRSISTDRMATCALAEGQTL
jgi:cobalt-precorrin 5A hydrolase